MNECPSYCHHTAGISTMYAEQVPVSTTNKPVPDQNYRKWPRGTLYMLQLLMKKDGTSEHIILATHAHTGVAGKLLLRR